MRYEIDLRDVRTREAFHDRIEQTVPCPVYYGRNLDAFYDVLTERGGIGELVFRHMEEFRREMPAYGAALQALCAEAVEQCPGLRISYAEESD